MIYVGLLSVLVLKCVSSSNGEQISRKNGRLGPWFGHQEVSSCFPHEFIYSIILQEKDSAELLMENGLDPIEFLKMARTKPKTKRVRGKKKKRRKMVAQSSSYGKKSKEILNIKSVPRAEFLIPGFIIFHLIRVE